MMNVEQMKYTPISITMKEMNPGIGAAPGLVCRMLIQMMLLILNTNGAEFAPQLNASIAGTIRLGIPMRLAMYIAIGNVAKIATNPSTPPYVRIHSISNIIKTARFACFSLLFTGITNLFTSVEEID